MINIRINNLVAQALINAHENNIDFSEFTASEIAQDIVDHDADLESEAWESLVPYIENWFEAAGPAYPIRKG